MDRGGKALVHSFLHQRKWIAHRRQMWAPSQWFGLWRIQEVDGTPVHVTTVAFKPFLAGRSTEGNFLGDISHGPAVIEMPHDRRYKDAVDDHRNENDAANGHPNDLRRLKFCLP